MNDNFYFLDEYCISRTCPGQNSELLWLLTQKEGLWTVTERPRNVIYLLKAMTNSFQISIFKVYFWNQLSNIIFCHVCCYNLPRALNSADKKLLTKSSRGIVWNIHLLRPRGFYCLSQPTFKFKLIAGQFYINPIRLVYARVLCIRIQVLFFLLFLIFSVEDGATLLTPKNAPFSQELQKLVQFAQLS